MTKNHNELAGRSLGYLDRGHSQKLANGYVFVPKGDQLSELVSSLVPLMTNRQRVHHTPLVRRNAVASSES